MKVLVLTGSPMDPWPELSPSMISRVRTSPNEHCNPSKCFRFGAEGITHEFVTDPKHFGIGVIVRRSGWRNIEHCPREVRSNN